MNGDSLIHRRRPPSFDVQFIGQLHSPEIAIRRDDDESVAFRNRCNPEVVFPEAEPFDVDVAQLCLFTGTETGDNCSLQFPVCIGRPLVDRKDLYVGEKTRYGRPVIGRVRGLFRHVDQLTMDHDARGDKDIAKGF